MEKKLKTLEEHNKERIAVHKQRNSIHFNGIACPKCGEELIDSNPGETLLSSPPKKNINCPNCGYRGTRLA